MARNKLFDESLTPQERVAWAVSELTTEEKAGMLATAYPAVERLGIPAGSVGGEAAHGVQARHDQSFDYGTPVETASFTQPIGLAATFDRELMKRIGEAVGVEGRALYNDGLHPCKSYWAPTVDMERDGRWGRNEEGYGEDPYLAGEIAGSYIRGMRGEDAEYVRIGATLKHFYANNAERNRGSASSNITPELKNYYFGPFVSCIGHGALGIMTAYNAVNGVPCMASPDVKLLRDMTGFDGHVVCDGGAMSVGIASGLFKDEQEAFSGSLKAGIDAFTEEPGRIRECALKALADGLIEEADIDRAVYNTLLSRLRLGEFCEKGAFPYEGISVNDIDRKANTRLARENAAKSVVLLKNEGGILPLDIKAGERILIAGNHADSWYTDWYGGTPYEKITIADGFRKLGYEVYASDCSDRVRIIRDGEYAYVSDGKLMFTADASRADVFGVQRWNYGAVTVRCPDGRLLRHDDEKGIIAELTEPFGWFVRELFYPVMEGEGLKVYDWQRRELVSVCVETVESGMEQAAKLAAECDHVIVTAGSTPLIGAKEEIDRPDTTMSAFDKKLFEVCRGANERAVLCLIANYPYNTDETDARAIITCASGNMELGRGIADVLTGRVSPAGRLAQTWYGKDFKYPDINDYDIKKNHMTYIYADKPVLYPFGYGLSYTEFAYSDISIVREDDDVRVRFCLENTGTVAGEEVWQAYVSTDVRRLAQFGRIALEPGQKKYIEFAVSAHEGQLLIGASSQDIRLVAEI